MIAFITVVSFALLLAAGALCVLRVLRRSSVPDRLIALDLLLVDIVLGIGVMAYQTQSDFFLDLLVVVSLLGFVGTVTVARFVEGRGA